MKQAIDKSPKQKAINRFQRLSEKIYSTANQPFESKLSHTKNQVQNEGINKEIEGLYDKNKYQTILELQRMQFQQLRQDLHCPINKLRKDKKLSHYKSEEAFGKRLSSNPQNTNSINYVRQTAEQYRKNIIENNQRKVTISMQAAVAKKQIEIAEKEKENSAAQNRQMKNEIIILKKDLMMSRENEDRLKRKFQIQIYEKNSQIQQLKLIIAELKDTFGKLKYKSEIITALEGENDKLKTESKKFNQEVQKLRESSWQLDEKNKLIEYNYKQLMEYNAKLQVNCQSLFKELNITKDYLSKTQLLLSASKEANYKNNEESLKQIEQKTTAIAALNNEVALVSKKHEETYLNLQKRQAEISQLQSVFQLQRKSKINTLLQKSKLQKELGSLQKKLSASYEQNRRLGSQLQQMKKLNQAQIIQLRQKQWTMQKMLVNHQRSELELVMSLEQELKTISAQNNQQLANLQNELITAENRNKQLFELITNKKIENQDLKELLCSKDKEISDYVKQIKQGIERHKNTKQQAQKALQREAQLQEELNQIQQQLNKSFEELNDEKHGNNYILKARETELITLKQGIRHKQNNMKNVQLEIIKQHQIVDTLLTTKDYVYGQQLNDAKSKTEFFEKAFKDQSAKNQYFSKIIAEKEAQNFKYSLMLQEIQGKVRIFQEQVQKLLKSGQQKGNQRQRRIKLFPQSQRKQNNQESQMKSIDQNLNTLGVKIQTIKNKKDEFYHLSNQLRQENESKSKTIEQLKGKILQIQKENVNLKVLTDKYELKLNNTEVQRETLLKIVETKSNQTEKIKKEMILLEEQSKKLFEQKLRKCQENFGKKLEEIDTEKANLLKQLQLFKLYKIKSEELENQVANLSILFRNESMKIQTQRNKNNTLTNQITQLRRIHKQERQKYVAQYNNQLQNLTQANKKQKDELRKQNENLNKDNEKLKMDLQSFNSEILINYIKTRSLILQLETLKIISSDEGYQIFQEKANQLLCPTKQVGLKQKPQIQHKDQKETKRQVIYDLTILKEKILKCGFSRYTLIYIEMELNHAQTLLDNLKEQREFFLKKYIFISNQMTKGGSQTELKSQIISLGSNLSQISTLHTELNKILVKIRQQFPQKSIIITKQQIVDAQKTQK